MGRLAACLRSSFPDCGLLVLLVFDFTLSVSRAQKGISSHPVQLYVVFRAGSGRVVLVKLCLQLVHRQATPFVMQHRKECVLPGGRLSIDCRMLVTTSKAPGTFQTNFGESDTNAHCLGIIPASHCIWTPVIMLLLATQIWTPLTANDAPELPPACTAIQQIPG